MIEPPFSVALRPVFCLRGVACPHFRPAFFFPLSPFQTERVLRCRAAVLDVIPTSVIFFPPSTARCRLRLSPCAVLPLSFFASPHLRRPFYFSIKFIPLRFLTTFSHATVAEHFLNLLPTCFISLETGRRDPSGSLFFSPRIRQRSFSGDERWLPFSFWCPSLRAHHFRLVFPRMIAHPGLYCLREPSLPFLSQFGVDRLVEGSFVGPFFSCSSGFFFIIRPCRGPSSHLRVVAASPLFFILVHRFLHR